MKIYDLLIATNTIGIIFIIIINYKTRKTQKGKGVWRNDGGGDWQLADGRPGLCVGKQFL